MKMLALNMANKLGRNPFLPGFIAIAMGPFVYYADQAPGQHEALVTAGIGTCLFLILICLICSFFVKPKEIRL